jgi:hypothetical protein
VSNKILPKFRKKMTKYQTLFNKLADQQTPFIGNDVKLWCRINEQKEVNVDIALQEIRKHFKLVKIMSYIKPNYIIGKCFQMVIIASQALIIARIKHRVTIGNVLVNGVPYYKTSPEIVANEMVKGYIADEVAHAHAWITLEDGTVIDLTILPSINYHKERKKPLKFIKYFYNSKEHYAHKIEHIPYHLGPEYIIRAITPPNESSFFYSYKWVIDIDELLTLKAD